MWYPESITPYWADDHSCILLGDSREILPKLADQSISLCLTDPPYGVDFKYGDQYDDARPDYAQWVMGIFAEMRRIANVTMLTTGMRNLWLYPPATWVLCWAKPGSRRLNGLGGFNLWEPVLMYGKRRIWHDFKLLPDSLKGAGESRTKGLHPCPKPLNLYRWLVKEGSDVGDIVLDPFLGSGTSAIAARALGRKCIGIEIEKKYCDLAIDRLRQQVIEFTPAAPPVTENFCA